jgi:inorganic pyrophosphatase
MNWPETFTKEKNFNIIIEAPYKSRNKYSYDEETGLFKLKKILPSGISFPCDMGFISNTLGDDGDPLDALILMDELTYPGCLVECRLLGVIEAIQTEKRKKNRNDRYMFVPAEMKEYDHLKNISDLNKTKVESIINFFKVYNDFYDVKFEVDKISDREQALKSIKKQLV